MIEIGKMYNAKELAEMFGISYGSFRNNKDKYLKHLNIFYEYSIIQKGREIKYLIQEQYSDFIPYVEYQRNIKNALIKEKVEQVIEQDARQTGSNIARIIKVDDEIKALDWQFSTLTVYTRESLKTMIETGEYVRSDYQWCYLDKVANKYILMSEEEVAELREYFNLFSKAQNEQEENAWSNYKQKLITKKELIENLGEMRFSCYAKGVEKYFEEHGFRPMKVPVYVKAQTF